MQQELSEGWSRVIQHDLTGKLDGHSWTIEFPVYIDCTYLNGRYNENGVARQRRSRDAPFIETPRDARYHYSKRFGIESSYRLSEQAIATMTIRDSTVRLLYVVVSLLLQNTWRYLHHEYVVATPPGRASPLVVAVQGVHQYGSTNCVDGPTHREGRPRESAIRRPVPPVVTDRASVFASGNAVASAAERRRQRQLPPIHP